MAYLKNKLVLFTLILIALVIGAQKSDAQNLPCSTYTSNILDTVAVSGSTDAASDWFTNAAYKTIFLEIYTGAIWYTYEIDYPCQTVNKFKINMEGSDTTVTVLGDVYGVSVTLPLKACAISSTSVSGDTFTLDIGATTAYWVRFRGIK